MPIISIPEKERLILHFGLGDIMIAQASVSDATDREGDRLNLILMSQCDPQPIGRVAADDPLIGTETDDYQIAMTFANKESLQVMIDQLESFKQNQFPSFEEAFDWNEEALLDGKEMRILSEESASDLRL